MRSMRRTDTGRALKRSRRASLRVVNVFAAAAVGVDARDGREEVVDEASGGMG